jgi:hypothetical protein
MLTVIGSTEAILAGMFRQHDAHAVAFWRWRFLYQHGICDRSGVILVGRRAGQKVRMP